MKKFILILTVCICLMNINYIVYSADNMNGIKAREFFIESGYDVKWDSDSKVAYFTSGEKWVLLGADGMVIYNDIAYFSNGAYLYDDRFYISQNTIDSIKKINNEKIPSTAPEMIQFPDSDKDKAKSIAANILHSFYGITIDQTYNINCSYYDDNTCMVLAENDDKAYWVDLKSDTYELINVSRTIIKSNYPERNSITKDLLLKYDEKIKSFLSGFGDYDCNGKIIYFIPYNNGSTVCCLFEDNNGKNIMFEFVGKTLEPMSLHMYDDKESAYNDVSKYIF